MREYKINIVPFSFISVLHCETHRSVNQHATAMVKGVIDQTEENRYLSMALEDLPVQILIYDEDDSVTVLFAGLIKDASIANESGLCVMSLELVSETYRMDHQTHIRIFQEAGASYDDLLNLIGAGYPGYSFLATAASDKPVSDLVVQYKETDWAFAVRMASLLHTVIVPECQIGGVKYFVGIPQRRDQIEMDPISYSVRKSVGEYLNKLERAVSGIDEYDAVYYLVKDREFYEIGQMVSFKGRSQYIYEAHCRLCGGELLHEYALKTQAGFQMPVLYNDRMTGASLPARIAGINQDQVTVQVQCEADPYPAARWYSFSTVYSAPDGTGWYCMPEEGDQVRLYFPNDQEGEGYIISATHLESGDGEERQNPDHKSMKTKYGKEVKFTPTTIEITNNNGMSIELLDQEGIKIFSNKAIKIISEEEITVASLNAEMQLSAADHLKIVQGETVVNLEDDVVVSGAQTNIQS